jgi:hypothetical protein
MTVTIVAPGHTISGTISAGQTISGGTVAGGDSLTVLSGGEIINTEFASFSSFGTIEAGGIAQSVTLDNFTVLYDYGAVNNANVEDGGFLRVYGTATNTSLTNGTEQIMPGGSAIGTIDLGGSYGELVVPGTSASYTDVTLENFNGSTFFADGDYIGLIGLIYSGSGTAILETGNILSVNENGETFSFKLDPNIDYAGETFSLGSDYYDLDINQPGTYGTQISLIPCFTRGTLIRTKNGDVPVESLAIGDLVVTADGAETPIRWIGRRGYDGKFIEGNHLMLPVRIHRGALADNVPSRDLLVSPGHAICLDDLLVPAWRLINSVSITQAESVTHVEYYHVELSAHGVLLAENCPAESFLDDSCRDQFQNAADYHALYPGRAASGGPCLPRVEEGFHLRDIQHRIAARAGIAPLAPQTGALRGYVDIAGPDVVCGWAQCAAQPEMPVQLEILAGGLPVLQVLANGYRADLRAAGLGSGCHAFTASLPAGFAGQVEIRRLADQATLAFTNAARAA